MIGRPTLNERRHIDKLWYRRCTRSESPVTGRPMYERTGTVIGLGLSQEGATH